MAKSKTDDTPGTITEEDALDARENNYLASVHLADERPAFAEALRVARTGVVVAEPRFDPDMPSQRVADRADQRQHGQAGQDPQRPDREPDRACPRRSPKSRIHPKALGQVGRLAKLLVCGDGEVQEIRAELNQGFAVQ